MKKGLLCIIALCLMLTSCFEDGYDLRHVDKTLHFGTDTLWTPFNCTGDVMLTGFIYETTTLKYLQIPDGPTYFAISVQDEYLTDRTGVYDFTVKVVAGSSTMEKGGVVVKSIDMGAMPSFLKEDDVVLDLTDPMVFVTAVNDAPSYLTTHFTIQSYDENGQVLSQCVTDDITLYPKSKERLCLAQSEPTNWAHRMKGARYVHAEGLPLLIKKIPHRIQVECADVVGQLEDPGQAGKVFDLKFRFGVFIPFEFGPDFHLVARDSTQSLGFELADYADLQPGEIVVEAKVDNDIALDVDVTGHLLDEAGREIQGLTINKVSVPARHSDYPVVLHLNAEAPYKLNNFMDGSNGAQKLHHLQAEATLTTGTCPSELITLDSKIRLHHVRVGIVGGITINAN